MNRQHKNKTRLAVKPSAFVDNRSCVVFLELSENHAAKSGVP